MVLIDRQYLARPYYGWRRMAAWLATQGMTIRGDGAICDSLFSYTDLEAIRADHPFRVICAIANAALKSLSCELQKLYSPLGRKSTPPEPAARVAAASVYSIRSERQLVERIDQSSRPILIEGCRSLEPDIGFETIGGVPDLFNCGYER
jgi:hypothetical protein